MNRIFILILCLIATVVKAQKTDSVIINVGEKSKVIFAIGDKADLQTLKQYNLQAVVDDLIKKLEQQDSTKLEKPAETYVKTEEPTVTRETRESEWRNDNYDNNNNNNNDNNNDWDRSWEESRTRRTRHYRRTYHSINFDIGTNNFITPNQQFPNSNNELYSVRPWGSWYVGINSIERTRLSRRFFLEWGGGISWYTFKFQDASTRLERNDYGVTFVTDDTPNRSHIKSKLGITFINASLVPVLDFGDHSRKPRIWNSYHSAFRIGLGPYVGYRISSLTKAVYKENGHSREKDKDHGNFYLNNLRYGARLQVGIRSTDFFFNYDMNDVFASGKGPNLNAFSFGVIF